MNQTNTYLDIIKEMLCNGDIADDIYDKIIDKYPDIVKKKVVQFKGDKRRAARQVKAQIQSVILHQEGVSFTIDRTQRPYMYSFIDTETGTINMPDGREINSLKSNVIMAADTIKRLAERLDQFVQWKYEYEKMRDAGEDVEDQLHNLEEDMKYVSGLLSSECEHIAPYSRRNDYATKLYKNDRMVVHRLRTEVGELKIEIEEMLKKQRMGYKTAATLLEEEDTFPDLRRCPKCGKYMEMSNVKEYVPGNCSYGSDMKRVVVGRLYKCITCRTEDYEKSGRWA